MTSLLSGSERCVMFQRLVSLLSSGKNKVPTLWDLLDKAYPITRCQGTSPHSSYITTDDQSLGHDLNPLVGLGSI
jgi:hypothetical protein